MPGRGEPGAKKSARRLPPGPACRRPEDGLPWIRSEAALSPAPGGLSHAPHIRPVRFPASAFPTIPGPSACSTFTHGASFSRSPPRSVFGDAHYDLRSNEAGIAVSGEITLHADRLYVQVSQPATGGGYRHPVRSCRDRRDYVGGVNNFASLDLLHSSGRACPPHQAGRGLRRLHASLVHRKIPRTEGPPPRAFFIRRRGGQTSRERKRAAGSRVTLPAMRARAGCFPGAGVPAGPRTGFSDHLRGRPFPAP